VDGCSPWTFAGGLESLSSARLSLQPFTWLIRHPLRFCCRNQLLSCALTNAMFVIPLGGPRYRFETDKHCLSTSLTTSNLLPLALLGQLLQQLLGALEIGGLEALGEPAVDWREEVRAPWRAGPDRATAGRGWLRPGAQEILPADCGRSLSPGAATMPLQHRRRSLPGRPL